MRRSSSLLCQSLVGIIFEMMGNEKQQPELSRSLWKVAESPTVKVQSLSFALPPKWATSLHTLLEKKFPGLLSRDGSRPVLYVQSFVHPSFAPDSSSTGTMKLLAPIGNNVLNFVAANWISSAMENLTAAQFAALVTEVTSDESLSRIVAEEWQLDSMILTDSLVDVLNKHGTGAGGLSKWVLHQRAPNMPASYGAEALRSFVGGVYADHGFDAAVEFCARNVIPHCAVR